MMADELKDTLSINYRCFGCQAETDEDEKELARQAKTLRQLQN